MKKYLLFIMVLVPVFAWSDEVTIEGITYNVIYHKYAEVVSVEDMVKVAIPPTIEHEGYKYDVKKIRYNAFINCKPTTTICIPSSISEISSNAFGNKVFERIEFDSFEHLNSLVFVYAENSPFYHFNHLHIAGKEVVDFVIPDGTTAISSYVLAGCKSLQSIAIPNSVTSIGTGAFKDCTNLKSYTLPADTKVIPPHVFSGCGFTSINVSDNIIKIEESAFSNCRQLTSISMGKTLKSIGTQAFSHCDKLTSVDLGTTLEELGHEAFCNCKSLTSVNIPNSVTKMERGVFQSCSSLTTVSLSDQLADIPQYCFYQSSRLSSVKGGSNIVNIMGYAFSDCTFLKSFDFPKGLNSIGFYAFSNSGIENVYLPDGVTQIDRSAFANCSNLTTVRLPDNDKINYSGDNHFSGCKQLQEIVIPQSVLIIPSFRGCESLSDVYCYATAVPKADMHFEGDYIEYATLHVPEAAINSYKTTSPWSNFGNIVALTDNTGIYSASSIQLISIKATGDGVKVSNIPTGTSCMVYTLDGIKTTQVTATDDNIFIPLSSGRTYIVKVPGKTFKVAL